MGRYRYRLSFRQYDAQNGQRDESVFECGTMVGSVAFLEGYRQAMAKYHSVDTRIAVVTRETTLGPVTRGFKG